MTQDAEARAGCGGHSRGIPGGGRDCQDEDQQRTIFERMTAEGFKCKLLTL